MEEDMARRAANDNYESDVDEEEAAAQQKQQQQQDDATGGEEASAALRVLAEAEKKLKELQDQEERLKVGLAQLASASHGRSRHLFMQFNTANSERNPDYGCCRLCAQKKL
jgi:hypothetical protein